MDPTMVVGLLSLAGTLVGSVGGILTANKLSSYRIEQLEKKMDKHNELVERVVVVERDLKTAFRQIDDVRDRVKDIEKGS